MLTAWAFFDRQFNELSLRFKFEKNFDSIEAICFGHNK